MKKAVSWSFSRLWKVLVFLAGVVASYEVERRYFDTRDYDQVRKFIESLIGGKSVVGFEEILMWCIAIFANLAFAFLVGTASVLIVGKVERSIRNWYVSKQNQWESLVNDVEQAYLLLRRVCEPETLDPRNLGNLDFMKAEARDFVNPMMPRLRKARFFPPAQCTTEDNSLREWFKYFENVRIKIAEK